MQPITPTYGGSSPVTGYTPPTADLSFGSIGNYGASVPAYSASTAYGAAAPAAVPAPHVATPGSNHFLPGVVAPPVPAVGGGVLPKMNTTDKLGTAFNGAVNGVPGKDPFSWGESMKGLVIGEDGQLNWGGLGMIAKGIGAIGGLWNAHKQNGIAEDALNFQKESYKTNLANSISSYNLGLEDRIRARYVTEGRSSEAADAYIAKHKLGK